MNQEQDDMNRLQGEDMFLGEIPHAEVAEKIGAHSECVARWMGTFQTKRRAGLQGAEREGRPSRLSNAQEERIKKCSKAMVAPKVAPQQSQHRLLGTQQKREP